MIVDDDNAIVDYLGSLVASIGYEVAGRASSGQEAIGMAIELKPDLILMDIVLDDSQDGITAIEKIREAGEKTPVIFLTGYIDDSYIDRAKKVAPLGYLLKPFLDWQIVAAIEVALHKVELERQLDKAMSNLEEQIKERTSELEHANQRLKEEYARSKEALNLLQEREKQLEENAVRLKEANTAMEILLGKRDRDQQELINKLTLNIRELIMPYVDKLRLTNLNDRQETYVDIIESNLEEAASPIGKGMSDEYLKLTPAEIQVANLLKQGKSTKAIADIISLSPRTVESYRDSIRKKLGLKHKKINLRTYLISKH